MNVIRPLCRLTLGLLGTGLLGSCSRPPGQPPTGEYHAALPSSGGAERSPKVAAAPPAKPAEALAPAPKHQPAEPLVKPAKKSEGTAASAKPMEKPLPPKVSPIPPTAKPTPATIPPAPGQERKGGQERRQGKAPAKPQEKTSAAPPTSASKGRGEVRPAEEEAPLVVLGEVLLASHVPEPGTVPYTECLTFIKYKVLAVEKGDYPHSELLAVHWGMKENRLTPAARYKAGQTYRLHLEPFDRHPELSRVMQADDTNEYELTPYWVIQ